MPKRKRSAQEELRATLENHQNEIFRAIKAVKGFERQRQSKQLRHHGTQVDKRQRIEREIAVLKVSADQVNVGIPKAEILSGP